MPARIGMKRPEKRLPISQGQSRVALQERTIEPLECRIDFPADRMDRSELIPRFRGETGLQLPKGIVRVLLSPTQVMDDRERCQSRPFGGFLACLAHPFRVSSLFSEKESEDH